MSIESDHAERWDYMQELLKEGAPKKKATNLKRKYIYRRDVAELHQHSWQVVIKVNAETTVKTFCDGACGGKTSALLAAVCWRDKQIAKHNLVFRKDLIKEPFVQSKKGVCRTTKTDRGYSYDTWVAYWQEDVKDKQVRRSKSFSINKYGEKRAENKAIKFREEKLKELYG